MSARARGLSANKSSLSHAGVVTGGGWGGGGGGGSAPVWFLFKSRYTHSSPHGTVQNKGTDYWLIDQRKAKVQGSTEAALDWEQERREGKGEGGWVGGGVNEATYTMLTSLGRPVKTADCYLINKFFTKCFTTLRHF